MHLSEKAVEPPGDARSDLDILLDYAHRLDLRDKDGERLISWSDPKAHLKRGKNVHAVGPVTTPGSL